MATKATPKKLSTVTALFDRAAELRKLKGQIEAHLREVKEELDSIEQPILDAMLASRTEQYKVADAGAYSITRKTVPQVDDWQALDAFILKKKDLALLHRRLTATTWAEYGENGITVPGTSAQTVTSLLWRAAK